MSDYIIDKRELPAQDGFDLRAELVPDYDGSTDDSDCYTPKQIAAWRNDDWRFVGIIVTASREGIDLGSASIWGTEYGDYIMTDEDDNVIDWQWVNPAYDDDYLIDLVSEALDEARATVKKINAEPSNV
jgi:hypothetical protein